MLVGHYVAENDAKLYYLDEITGDTVPDSVLKNPAVYLIAHNPEVTYGEQLDFVKGWYNGKHRVTEADEALTVATANGTDLSFAPGSIVVDPWRKIPDLPGVEVIQYGNTRN